MDKSKIKNMFAKIEPDVNLKNRVLGELEDNIIMKRKAKNFKSTALIAAALAMVIGVTSVYAMSPNFRETISDIISYFKSDEATEITNLEKLAEYNQSIGTSVSKKGYTLTLDNVAADDNFVHIFYTLESEMPFDRQSEPNVWIECIINGKSAYAANNNTFGEYYENDNKYKAVIKSNISTKEIPDKFNVELLGFIGEDYSFKVDEDGTINISEKMKNDNLYINQPIDKSKVKVDIITKNINQKIKSNFGQSDIEAEIEKVIFSPFGNQFVVKDYDGGKSASVLRTYAMVDENGKYLDVLDMDLCGSKENKETRNAFEFLKGNSGMKSFKLIPLQFDDKKEVDSITKNIGQYPIEYNLSEYGKIVITNITFKDGEIDIDYYKDGYTYCDPAFILLDDNGNNAEPGGKLGCVLRTEVHYATNSYTAKYIYDNYDKKHMGDEVKKESLQKNFTQLRLFKQDYTLDFDNAINVKLD